jgi:LytS/YehU family sensor histidine kinase
VVTKSSFPGHHKSLNRHINNHERHSQDEHQPQGSFEMEGPGGPPHTNVLRIVFFDYSLYMFVIVLFCALLLKTNQRWRKLQQEQLETELSYLKAQINPHFLFNTLNSIYSLAIEKSDYTATAVVKLSGMMRYIISESHKNFVSLEKEVNYINDYVELQKFRLGDTVDIQYSLQGNYYGKEIAPLILITFVENAFKYGVNPEQHSKILAVIHIEDDRLILKVENNKVTTLQDKAEAPGLGISNTRNRLEMLYPRKHQLHIDDGAEQFKIHLEIMLQ